MTSVQLPEDYHPDAARQYPVQKLEHVPGIDLQYRLCPHLDHMDVAQLSFIQGLRHFYPME